MSGRTGSTVLVSGGAGYVGSHVVLALREAGYAVAVVDDLSTGHRDAVPRDAVLVEADAGDRRTVGAIVARHGIEAAIHLAGAVGVDEPAERARRSGAMSAAFVEACAEAGVRRFVLTSSAAVYGSDGAPASAYGAGKRRAERLVRAAFGGPRRSHAVLRCFNVAGADPQGRAGPRRGAAAGLVQAACEAALGLREAVTVFGTDHDTADGTGVRDYVHPSDVAAAHVAALRALERGSGSFTADCGSGRGHSVREVLAAVERETGAGLPVRTGPRRRGDVAVSVAEPERIGRLPGWRARHGDLGVIVSSALAWTQARAGRDGNGGSRPRGAAADPDARAPARQGYKRPFDLGLVALGLVVLAPLWLALGLGIALAIRLEDRGRVLYRQPRLGRGGAVFEILKFRTMVEGAEARSGPVRATPADPRVTRVGRVLRRLHLDELPQVVNIVRGEMSLVGPRPERPELTARFERAVPGFSARLRVRPGVAGLAQAVGAYHWAPRQKLRYDNLYIATMSPWLDLKLCLRCLVEVVRPRRRVAAPWSGRVGPR